MKYTLKSNWINACLILFLFCQMPSISFAQPQKLKVSDNHRFLVKEDGSPFVWIGDTNWFFAKLPPTTIDSLLDVRRGQGYTMMFVSCREKLYNGAGPGTINQPNEAWWAYLDEYIEKCKERNMYVGITLGWWAVAKNNTKEALYKYGKWVGNRYKEDDNIVWLTLGETGSHKRKDEIPPEKIKALVRGIREGDTGDKLLTVHADFKRGTSISDIAEICDFNNWQTSQWCCIDDLPRKDDRKWTVWEAIQYDYQQTYEGIPKPTLDAEAWYENNKDFCGADAFTIRRRAYFTILAGAFGHTYGAGGIWDGLSKEEGCSEAALDAIHYPGAKQIGFVSNFFHALGDSFLKLTPDQSLVTAGNSDDYDRHIQASLADDGSFALVYSASDRPFQLDLSKLSGRKLKHIWYNPRTHQYNTTYKVRLNASDGQLDIDPPGELGAGNDWVLILGRESLVADFVPEGS